MPERSNSKVAISIDYVLRIPDFQNAFLALKKTLIQEYHELAAEGNKEAESYWTKNVLNNEKKLSFYEKVSIPEYNKDFDFTYKKYFFDEQDRIKFLEEFSFNLYGKSESTGHKNIEFINIIQSQLCDVYLFDRVHNPRKVINTFAWLSKSSLQIKGVEFISPNDDLKELTKDFLDLYDPYKNSNEFIYSINSNQNPLMEFAFKLEKKINPEVIQ